MEAHPSESELRQIASENDRASTMSSDGRTVEKKTETESEGQKFRPGRLTECHDGDSAGSMKNERATVSGIIVPGPAALSSRGAIIVGEFILRLVALTDVTNLSVALNPRPRA